MPNGRSVACESWRNSGRLPITFESSRPKTPMETGFGYSTTWQAMAHRVAIGRDDAQTINMTSLDNLLTRNRAWATRIRQADPDFFYRLAHQQSPHYLWIGCSDSRVPSTQLVDLAPGEMFVHRNVANVVAHTDLNCLSVIQYAVEVLKVEHIIVCGHYGCGGVQAAIAKRELGLIDNWLGHVQDVIEKHKGVVERIEGEAERVRMVCELNVIEQVVNVCQTTIVRDAWLKGQEFRVEGLVYGLEDGLLRELGMSGHRQEEIEASYGEAVRNALERGLGMGNDE